MNRLLAILACSLVVAVCPALADPDGPVLVGAGYTCVTPPGVPCPPTSREVIVGFDEPVDPVTASDLANYLFHPVADPSDVIPLDEVWGVWDQEAGLFFAATPADEDYLLTVTGVEDLEGNLMAPQSWVVEPMSFPDAAPDLPAPLLLSAAPNPFNPATELSFELPVAGTIDLAVYDLAGRRVATLATGHRKAGPSTLTWRAEGLASGSYLIRLRVGWSVAEHKVSLVR